METGQLGGGSQEATWSPGWKQDLEIQGSLDTDRCA